MIMPLRLLDRRFVLTAGRQNSHHMRRQRYMAVLRQARYFAPMPRFRRMMFRWGVHQRLPKLCFMKLRRRSQNDLRKRGTLSEDTLDLSRETFPFSDSLSHRVKNTSTRLYMVTLIYGAILKIT